MERPVFTKKSSTIHKVSYDPRQQHMEIEFRTGDVYRYFEVPSRLWQLFRLYIDCQGSAGAFFNEYVKNRFRSRKQSPDAENNFG
jgi:hypothetical protein